MFNGYFVYSSIDDDKVWMVTSEGFQENVKNENRKSFDIFGAFKRNQWTGEGNLSEDVHL